MHVTLWHVHFVEHFQYTMQLNSHMQQTMCLQPCALNTCAMYILVHVMHAYRAASIFTDTEV